MIYQDINCIQDIKTAIAAASSDDGETITLEHKGSAGKTQFTRDEKKLLAKEICAFANTYGGVVCFHFGCDTTILPFPDSKPQEMFNSIEGWLSSSLEPVLQGIDLKIVDNLFLINIPESKTKPHRTNTTKEWLYRHATQSTPMPEIMISSMYRSQEHLSYSCETFVSKSGKNDLTVHSHIENHSNLAGSHPRLNIQLFGKINPQNTKLTNSSGSIFQEANSYNSTPVDGIPLGFAVTTTPEFSQTLLYPKEKSVFYFDITIAQEVADALKGIVVRTDCFFKEVPGLTKYRLLKVEATEIVDVTNSNDHSAVHIFTEYKKLAAQLV